MIYKETEIPIEDISKDETVVEIKVEGESENTSIDVTEITKLLSKVIISASELIAELNKINGK